MFPQMAMSGIPYVLSWKPLFIIRIYASNHKIPENTIIDVNINYFYTKLYINFIHIRAHQLEQY